MNFLSLGANRIRTIHPNVFVNLVNLNLLSIFTNELEIFDPSVLSTVKN